MEKLKGKKKKFEGRFEKFYYVSGALTPSEANPSIEENGAAIRRKGLELMEAGFGAILPVWFGTDIEWDNVEYWEDLIVIHNDFGLQRLCAGTYFLKSAFQSNGGQKELRNAYEIFKERDGHYDIIFEGGDDDPTIKR